MNISKYEVQDNLMPQNLVGISDDQIKDHWQLYKGYVVQVNKLNQKLSDLTKNNKTDTLCFADRRRRYGFEYNGMVLHEYYFGNLKAGESELGKGDLYSVLEQSFGSYENWKKDFELAGKTRGIGWAIVYVDTTTGFLTNHFIAEHQNGTIAGFHPILVMDVWEHAYMVDHRAGGRGDYISAFMKNINWEIVQKRYNNANSCKANKRF
jgi:Fe-Mn family superoxide dismutase